MMRRRSFFGVVFGGFLARWLAPPRWWHFHSPVITFKPYWPNDPKYQFGFTGFKPAQSGDPPSWIWEWVQRHHPEAVGSTARVIIDRHGVAWWAPDRDPDLAADERLYYVPAVPARRQVYYV